MSDVNKLLTLIGARSSAAAMQLRLVALGRLSSDRIPIIARRLEQTVREINRFFGMPEEEIERSIDEFRRQYGVDAPKLSPFQVDIDFSLPPDCSHEKAVDLIYEAGLTDAIIGTGTPGEVAVTIEFLSETQLAAEAEVKWLVLTTIPGSHVIR